MRYGWIYILLICTVAFTNPGAAQQGQWPVPGPVDTTQGQYLANHHGKRIQFSNLNSRESYYFNKRKLKKINKLERKKDYQGMIRALEEYVSNFGPENFGRDANLLWLLGQMYENFGNKANAKWMYRLVLKHANANTRFVEQYYENMKRNKRENYVAIEYYYKLVDYRKQVDTLHPPQGVNQYMGSEVNSAYDDYGPSLSYNNQKLLFASKRHRVQTADGERTNEDLFWAKKKGESWGEAKPLKPLNSPYNEGAPCLSPDGQTIFFARCDVPEGMGDCDLYMASKQPDGSWGNARNMGKTVNSKRWDSHPSLSPTGDTLYFASNRLGGFGSNDIYFTYRNHRGEWMPPQNMGPTINSKGNDISPFYHPEHHVLYFSSNGHILNFGNFDIYKSYFDGNHWGQPKNIGPLVNTAGNEHFFAIDSKSDQLFYSRSDIQELGKNANLYTFPLPMGAQPAARTKFQGTLKDSVTGEAFDGIVSIIDKETGIEVAPKYLRRDGSFEFDLIKDKKYLLVIRGEDFFRVEKHVNLKNDTTINIEKPSINYLRLQFESIEFSTNKAEIKPEMKPDLNKLMDFLLDHPAMNLKISGHTDARGDSVINYKLSQARADAIKEYIVNKGHIDEGRVQAQGYGSSLPIIQDPQNARERRVNRRVEFELENSGREVSGDWR